MPREKAKVGALDGGEDGSLANNTKRCRKFYAATVSSCPRVQGEKGLLKNVTDMSVDVIGEVVVSTPYASVRRLTEFYI